MHGATPVGNMTVLKYGHRDIPGTSVDGVHIGRFHCVHVCLRAFQLGDGMSHTFVSSLLISSCISTVGHSCSVILSILELRQQPIALCVTLKQPQLMVKRAKPVVSVPSEPGVLVLSEPSV